MWFPVYNDKFYTEMMMFIKVYLPAPNRTSVAIPGNDIVNKVKLEDEEK